MTESIFYIVFLASLPGAAVMSSDVAGCLQVDMRSPSCRSFWVFCDFFLTSCTLRQFFFSSIPNPDSSTNAFIRPLTPQWTPATARALSGGWRVPVGGNQGGSGCVPRAFLTVSPRPVVSMCCACDADKFPESSPGEVLPHPIYKGLRGIISYFLSVFGFLSGLFIWSNSLLRPGLVHFTQWLCIWA